MVNWLFSGFALLLDHVVAIRHDGLVGDRLPAEVVAHARSNGSTTGAFYLSASAAWDHASAGYDSLGHRTQACRRIGQGAGAVVQLVDGHEISGFAIGGDFGDAAGRGADHRQATPGAPVPRLPWLNQWMDGRMERVRLTVPLKPR